MHEAIYERLKAVAMAGSVTTYADIAPMAGLDMSNPDHRNRIGEILGEISSAEHAQGRPMLSAVVIQKDNNIPGSGFFTLAKQLGLYSGADDVVFFVKELRRVHNYWTQ